MGSTNEHGLFVNDGSFLERFKQLQQEQQDASKLSPVTPDGQELTSTSGNNHHEATSSPVKSSLAATTGPGRQSFSLSSKAGGGGGQKAPANAAAPTNGKLAFSLKQKSRLAVNALKLGVEEDEDGEDGQGGDNDRRSKKLKSDKGPGASISDQGSSVAPPLDPEVRKVADKLASFVAKNGRQFENITRQKNPGDTPFRFLFDVNSPEYKYYENQLIQEEQALQRADAGSGGGSSGNTRPHASHARSSYSTPASALFSGSSDDRGRQQRDPAQDNVRQAAHHTTDSVSMMEFYMKKAAQEDSRKPGKQSLKDEMPPLPAPPPPPPEKTSRHSPAKWAVDDVPNRDDPAPYPPVTLTAEEAIAVAAGKKGHHMGDYIPPEELEKFLAKCNDAMAQKAAKATAERAKIQADNVGHRLLSKMGWKEGEGLGSQKGGRADPVQAGNVKLNNLGVGAEQPGEVTPDDDIYEQYKKRMMLGYRFRPNPLNNPRKAYY